MFARLIIKSWYKNPRSGRTMPLETGQLWIIPGTLPILPDILSLRELRLKSTLSMKHNCNRESLKIGRAHAELQSRGHLVCRLLLETKNKGQTQKQIGDNHDDITGPNNK